MQMILGSRDCIFLRPVYTERQSHCCNNKHYDDTSYTVLIENNGVARKWFANPFWSGFKILQNSPTPPKYAPS